MLGNKVVSHILTSNGTNKFFLESSVPIYSPTSSVLQHQILSKPTNTIILLSSYYIILNGLKNLFVSVLYLFWEIIFITIVNRENIQLLKLYIIIYII